MPVDIEKVRAQHAKDLAASHSAGEYKKRERPKFWKPKNGNNTIRILPTVGDRDLHYVETLVSYNVGPNNKVVNHPSDPDAPNPLMEHIHELEKQGGKANLDRVNAMRPRRKRPMFIIDREDEEAGPQLWSTSPTVFMGIDAIFADAEYGDITDKDTGVDIKFQYNAAAQGPTHYYPSGFLPSRHATPLTNPDWIKEDLFEKHSIGRPTDPELVKHFIAGTEDQYFAEKRAAREVREAAEKDTGPVDAPTQANPPAETQVQEALAAQLEGLQKKLQDGE